MRRNPARIAQHEHLGYEGCASFSVSVNLPVVLVDQLSVCCVCVCVQVLDPLAQKGKEEKYNRVKAREKKMSREWVKQGQKG